MEIQRWGVTGAELMSGFTLKSPTSALGQVSAAALIPAWVFNSCSDFSHYHFSCLNYFLRHATQRPQVTHPSASPFKSSGHCCQFPFLKSLPSVGFHDTHRPPKPFSSHFLDHAFLMSSGVPLQLSCPQGSILTLCSSAYSNFSAG